MQTVNKEINAEKVTLHQTKHFLPNCLSGGPASSNEQFFVKELINAGDKP